MGSVGGCLCPLSCVVQVAQESKPDVPESKPDGEDRPPLYIYVRGIFYLFGDDF